MPATYVLRVFGSVIIISAPIPGTHLTLSRRSGLILSALMRRDGQLSELIRRDATGIIENRRDGTGLLEQRRSGAPITTKRRG